jgi:GDP-L-fucose synthase
MDAIGPDVNVALRRQIALLPRGVLLNAPSLDPATLHAPSAPDQAPLINVGVGIDITIRELAEQVKSAVGYSGELIFDTTKPDGTPRKLLDVGRLHGLGWKARTPFRVGLQAAYDDFLRLGSR